MKTNFRTATILVVTLASLLLVADARGVICTYESTDVPKNIPDPGTVFSSLTVPDSMIITDVDVVLNITHNNDADLDVYLVAPDGTQVELFTDVGGSGDNFENTTLDDEAATSIRNGYPPFGRSYKPEGRLSDFDGLNAKGIWQLKVIDDDPVCSGTVNSWRLIIEGCPFPLAPANPNPADGSENVSIDTCLSWDKDPASPDTTWDVYFGIDPDALVLIARDLTEPNFCPGQLNMGTWYSWQVVAKNPCGQTPGPIWSFETSPPVPFAKYSGGTGTAEDPYRIATAKDLNTIGLNEEDWDKYFILVNDIDLSAYTGSQFNIIGKGLPPRFQDPNTRAFSGVFDGKGHRIWNFTFNTINNTTNVSSVGLFRYLLPGGQIKNLGMENVNIEATGYFEGVGAVAGVNSGTISACYSTGNVRGPKCVGGLVGYNEQVVINCYSTASISGRYEYGGGLVGLNNTIINSYSTGKVWDVGGRIGGLAGGSSAVVNSFWDIETSGQSVSGGGKGKTTAEMKMASTYFGWGGCGNEGVWTIDEGKDYPRLAWEGRPGQPIPKQQLSDLVPGSGTESDPYLTSTAEQLNSIGLFPCEWDKHFKLVNDIDLSAYKGTEFNIIGTVPNPFLGVFDGNHHKIWNFAFECPRARWWLGLFGGLGSPFTAPEMGVIKNLGLENVNVNCPDDSYYVGALAGLNQGTIRNCHASGRVAGTAQVGGLVGVNQGSMMESCYIEGTVLCGPGDGSVGGLVGVNYGLIKNYYSTANVSGSGAGGLIGHNASWLITNCYSAGVVTGQERVGGLIGSSIEGPILTGSFWDVEASGQTSSAGGTGKTTAEMKRKSTFTDAGWDFVNIWDIIEGQTYPFLR